MSLNSQSPFQQFNNPYVNSVQNSGYVDMPDGSSCYMGIKEFQKFDTFEKSGEEKKPINKKLIGLATGVATAAILLLADKDIRRSISRLFRSKVLPFDKNKVISALPTPQGLEQSAITRHAKGTLSTIFDEANIDLNGLVKVVEENTSGVYSRADEIANQAIADKDKLHILNLLLGFAHDNEERLSGKFYGYDLLDFLTKLPKDCDTSFIETSLKIMQNSSKHSYMTSGRILDLASKSKETCRLDSVFDLFKKGLPKDLTTGKRAGDWMLDTLYVAGYNSSILDNVDEAGKFLATLRKGTLNKEYDLSALTSMLTDSSFDLKKARKFYEAIDEDKLSKISIYNLGKLIDFPDMSSVEVSKFINGLSKDALRKIQDNDLPSYIEFRDYLGVSNINELDMAQKKALMQKLIRSNSDLFGSKFAPIIPSNKDEYCALLKKLSKSIGVDTRPLTQAQAQTFASSLTSLMDDITGVDLSKVTIRLKMSRDDFMTKAEELLSGLSDLERKKAMDYFGFEIVDGKLKGHPINVNNGKKLSEISSRGTKKVIEKLRPIVEEFTGDTSNPIIVTGASKQFEDELNGLLKGLPELRTMIGKAQHHTHAFTLDEHTFRVLQNVCNNPRFQALGEDDKKVLSIASLLHDITKLQGTRDPMHPIESAFDAYYIIQKFNLPEDQQLKIYELIKTHNWLQRLNDPTVSAEMVENIAQDIAFDARHTNTFEFAKILCEADLKSVKKDASFFNRFKDTLDSMSEKVDGYLKHIKETQIFLPQTRIPHASKLTGGVEMAAEGVKNKVIYLEKAPDDLSTIGFDPGTTKDNLGVLFHALERPDQMGKFDTFSVIDSEALLSTSYGNAREYRVFRKQGLILDVNTNDIHAGYHSDFGTGYSKDIELLKLDYLFRGSRKDNLTDTSAWRGNRTLYRSFISDKVKEAMGITNEEYIARMDRIQSCKSMTDIEKVDSEFAAAIKKVFDGMDSKKRAGGRKYNEMLVSRPRIQGVFAYDKPYEKIPLFLRKYAQDNDLPIIIFGNVQ